MNWMVLAVLAVGSAVQPDRDGKPHVAAFFNRIDDGPAFLVNCRNTTPLPLSSASPVWTEVIRLDGTVVPEPAGRLGPGLVTDVQPGSVWRGIIAFRQSARNYYPAPKFGALLRAARDLHLAAGAHTLAVQCNGVWSDEITFYWDDERVVR